MTTNLLPLRRCACGNILPDWCGRGRIRQVCDDCRKRDIREAQDLYAWKRREWKKANPKPYSAVEGSVRVRANRQKAMERAGQVQCACGRPMWRLTLTGQTRTLCDACRYANRDKALRAARARAAARVEP